MSHFHFPRYRDQLYGSDACMSFSEKISQIRSGMSSQIYWIPAFIHLSMTKVPLHPSLQAELPSISIEQVLLFEEKHFSGVFYFEDLLDLGDGKSWISVQLLYTSSSMRPYHSNRNMFVWMPIWLFKLHSH